MGNWSELPRDLLRSITSFLPIADIHRFSSVCREWNFVSKERTHPPAAQLPWLVLTDHEITKKRMFYNMSEKKYYQFDIPELHGARCHGSSFGWLFVVGPRLETHLINPFSGAKHSLPRAPPYNFKREYHDDYLIEYGYKYPCILEPCIFSYEHMQRIIVHKAILSADPNKCTDFVLMIMLNGDHRLAIWRVGDKDWTVLKENRYIVEITCFKGQFFALLVNHKLATVDVSPEPKLIKHKSCLRDCISWAARYFINVSDISLLLVVRRTKKDENDDEHFTTSEFRVFELDLEENEAYEIEDIMATPCSSVKIAVSTYLSGSLVVVEKIASTFLRTHAMVCRRRNMDMMTWVFGASWMKQSNHYLNRMYTCLQHHVLFGWYQTPGKSS